MAEANKIRRPEVAGNAPPEVDERRLIEKVQARDEAAFQVLLQRYKRLVTGIANRMLQNASGPGVDDIVNKVRLKVWEKIGKFRLESKFSSWISKITVHLCLTELRRKKRELDRMLPLEDHNSFEDKYEQWRENVESRLDIARQVLALSKPNHQRVIDMVYWQGESTYGAASLMGESEDHVRYVLRCFQEKVRDAVKTHLPGQRVVLRSKAKKTARSK